MKSRIIGTGSCLPAAKVTNDWLSTKMDTSDEWIVSRTGIRERRIAREETTTDMAEQAARLALEDAGIAPEDLDLILVGTITADHVTPSAACELQARLGAGNAMALISMRPARDFCLPWRAQMLFSEPDASGMSLCWGRKHCPGLWTGRTEAPASCSGTEQGRPWYGGRMWGSSASIMAVTAVREMP